MAKTILVVEDDQNISELLRLYLEKEGYTVTYVGVTPEGIVNMDELRAAIDAMEIVVDDNHWPVPTYNEILFYC